MIHHTSAKADLYLNIIAKAKIAGVYIVMSTQMPSSAVLSKSIISKCTARIAFAMASQKDSIAILEEYGAEELAGNGELLFRSFKTKEFVKLQGVYVSDREIGNITEYARKKGKPKYHDSFAAKFLYMPRTNNIVSAPADPMMDEIVEYVIEAQKASTSLLQRRFDIGYNRAARIIDELEERGIIGPAIGSKPREVYKKRKYNHSAMSGSAEEGSSFSAKTDTSSPHTEYKSEGTDSSHSNLDYSMTLKLVGVEETDSDNQIHKINTDKLKNRNEKIKAVTKPTDWLVMLTFVILSLLYAAGITSGIWVLVAFIFGIFGFVLSAPFLRGRVMEVVKDDNLRFALIVLCYFIIIVATVNEVH